MMQRISTPRADILPAFLIAAVPLAFLAAISFYQVFVNVPAARSVHEKILNSFFVVRTASDLCGEIQSAERGQRGLSHHRPRRLSRALRESKDPHSAIAERFAASHF